MKVCTGVLLFTLLGLAACGTTEERSEVGESTDAGNTSPDAGNTSPDAGNTSPDAGGSKTPDPTGNPNDHAVGIWELAGVDGSACGMNLRSGFDGAIVASTTHEFTLTLKSTFNQQVVSLDCEVETGTKFTCKNYEVGMVFGACYATGGLRNISGHLSATSVDLAGTVHSTGTGQCQPSVHCGPRELSVIGTVARP